MNDLDANSHGVSPRDTDGPSPKEVTAITAPLSKIEKLQLEAAEMERAAALLARTIGPGETIVQRANKRRDGEIKLARDRAKDSLAILGSLKRASEKIGFDKCRLDFDGLCGGLDELLKRSLDPTQATELSAAGKKLLDAKRRPPTVGLFCKVSAEHFGAECRNQAKALGLKFTDFTEEAYSGRAALEGILALGRDYGLTIKIELEKKVLILVAAGIVDEAIRDRVQAAEVW